MRTCAKKNECANAPVGPFTTFSHRACGYNIRNELISAAKSVGGDAPGAPQSPTLTTEYAYQYDDIGNRILSFDLGTNRTYTANNLNQYLEISTSDAGLQTSEFEPQYDDDMRPRRRRRVARRSEATEPRSGRKRPRNDALRSIARRRDLPKDDVDALLVYLRKADNAMRPERVAALKNDVMNLLRNQAPPPKELAETLIAMIEGRPVVGFGRSGRAGVPPPAADGDGTPSLLAQAGRLHRLRRFCFRDASRRSPHLRDLARRGCARGTRRFRAVREERRNHQRLRRNEDREVRDVIFFRHRINRIYRITVVGDLSWRAECPASHPNRNSVNSVNTVSKTKERICTELESST